MRVLFLDDDQERHNKFTLNSTGCDVDHVYTAQEAIDSLASVDYRLVMLDHDLGGKESEGRLDCKEDGRMVARFIAENPERFTETTFVIHSLNAAGAKEMKVIIKEKNLIVETVPFAWRMQCVRRGDKLHLWR